MFSVAEEPWEDFLRSRMVFIWGFLYVQELSEQGLLIMGVYSLYFFKGICEHIFF